MCGFAWFNLGALQSQQGERQEALISFPSCALVQRWDVEAWANALLLCTNSENHGHLMPWILLAAFAANGDRFLQQLDDKVQAQDVPPDAKHSFMDLIRRALDTIPAGESPTNRVLIRHVLPGGDYHKLELGRISPDQEVS